MIIKSLVLTYGIACNLMYQLFLVGVRLEERDLENILPEYKQYKKGRAYVCTECGHERIDKLTRGRNN